MISLGIITEKVAGIVKNEECLPLQEEVKGRYTKKARAFKLFAEGKGPSSPEVLALGMHKSTRFKYYHMYVISQ